MGGSDDHFRLDDVTVAWGETPALDRVDWRVEPGEIVAMVGPSGAGKTSLLRLLNGTLGPTSGVVSHRGRDLASLRSAELRAVRSRIGWIPQDGALVPELRVVQNVATGRVGRRGFVGMLRDLFVPARDDVRAIHARLERVGIPEKLWERVDHLSGGERQRVAVARALHQEPDALLADEPVSSVDPARARDLVALLRDLAQERGLTLVVSLHQADLAREFFPRLVGLRGGKILFDRAASAVHDDDLAALYDLGAPTVGREECP